jgi:hypothetical protein
MAKAATVGPVIRNPLVVFGLILLAGDGPLVVGYGLSRGTGAGWVFALACVVFVFGMGAVFCLLVWKHPRHLYHPEEIPAELVNESIYGEKAKDSPKIEVVPQSMYSQPDMSGKPPRLKADPGGRFPAAPTPDSPAGHADTN